MVFFILFHDSLQFLSEGGLGHRLTHLCLGFRLAPGRDGKLPHLEERVPLGDVNVSVGPTCVACGSMSRLTLIGLAEGCPFGHRLESTKGNFPFMSFMTGRSQSLVLSICTSLNMSQGLYLP